MVNKNKPLFLPLLFLSATLLAEDLNYTIKGQGSEKAELETLSPSPDIPSADSILFSLDGGKSAREDEVVPLSPFDAVLKTDESQIPPPVLPLIPEAPFIVQPLPIGDSADIRQNQDVFGEGREEALEQYDYEFKVVDDKNRVLHRKVGKGRPPNPLTWDGFVDGEFFVNPNNTFNSFLILRVGREIIGTWPGEAVRFMACAHWEEKDFVVRFSRRIYNWEESTFSGAGKIFLEDVARRLFYHVHQSYGEEKVEGSWSVILFEPQRDIDSNLAQARMLRWKGLFEKVLGEIIPEDKFRILPTTDDEALVQLVFQDYKQPIFPNMRGKAAPPRPKFESATKWVNFKETKETLFVDLRYDRLFLPGSAYLRDEALPELAAALDRVNQEAKKPKRKKKHPSQKPIVVRSFTKKVHDKKRNKKIEDTRLAALRSKVLFMLFAKERYLP